VYRPIEAWYAASASLACPRASCAAPVAPSAAACWIRSPDSSWIVAIDWLVRRDRLRCASEATVDRAERDEDPRAQARVGDLVLLDDVERGLVRLGRCRERRHAIPLSTGHCDLFAAALYTASTLAGIDRVRA